MTNDSSLVKQAIIDEGAKRDPRKAWLIVDGSPVPLVMDNWVKQGDYLVDHTSHGEIRMVIPVNDIIAVKFYDR